MLNRQQTAGQFAGVNQMCIRDRTCVCANRLYVQDGVYDRFAEKLQQAVEKLRIGDGLQDGVTTGPLIDEKAVEMCIRDRCTRNTMC